MSRDDGFAVADMDSGYFDDAKMRELWQKLRDPDRMARAICLHSATTLASWRQGCRVTVAQAVPLWLPMDADLVTALRAVKLLDRAGKVPAEAWQVWFGTAYERREIRRAAGRTGGLASGKQRSLPGERMLKQPSTDAEPVRPSVPTVPSYRPSDLSVSEIRLLEEKRGLRGVKP